MARHNAANWPSRSGALHPFDPMPRSGFDSLALPVEGCTRQAGSQPQRKIRGNVTIQHDGRGLPDGPERPGC